MTSAKSGGNAPETVIAIYRVKADELGAFLELLKKHVPTLRRVGLVTNDAPVFYKGAEDDGRPIVFEIFTWKDGKAPEVAHQTPEVMKIWEVMGTMTEERDGRPQFEFPHVERFDVELAQA
jgi:hypothetical protein